MFPNYGPVSLGPGLHKPVRVYPLPNGVMASAEEYAAILKRKRRAITRMCRAASDFLTIDIDTALDAIARPTDEPEPYALAPGALLSEFNEVSTYCSELETRIGQLHEAIERAEQEKDGPGPMIAASMGTVLPMMEHQLRERQQHRAYLQKELEALETAPAAPEGGE